MPRGPRLEAPGVFHHVLVRGIEQRAIVRDVRDRAYFVARVGVFAHNMRIQQVVIACVADLFAVSEGGPPQRKNNPVAGARPGPRRPGSGLCRLLSVKTATRLCRPEPAAFENPGPTRREASL